MSSLFCSICSEAFSDPRLLPCLHVFCKGCLDSCYSEEEEKNITCPTCYRTSSTPPTQLPRHLRAERDSARLAIKQDGSDGSEAVCGSCEEKGKCEAYCKECAFPLCSSCVKIHKRIKATRNHSIVPLDQSQPPAINARCVPCVIHPDEVVKYYCSSCSLLACSECLFAHKEHECGRLDNDELSKKERSELKLVLDKAEEAISPLNKAVEKIGEVIKCTQVNQDKAMKKIDEVFKQIADAVEKRHLELKEEVKNMALAKTTQLEIQKEGLEKICASLQLALEIGRATVSDYSNIEVFAVKGSISHALKDLLQENSSAQFKPGSSSGLRVSVDNLKVIDLVSSLGKIVQNCLHAPAKCSLLGINPNLTIGVAKGTNCTVTLQTRSENGTDLIEEEANLQASLLLKCNHSSSHKCNVNDLNNGRYEISFDNLEVGQYQLVVTIDDISIADCSLTINVRDYLSIKSSTSITTIDGKPAYIDIGPDNLCYISLDDGPIMVTDKNLNVIRQIPQSKLGSCSLRGIAVDSENGVMFLASAGSNQIIKATLDGDVIQKVGGKRGSGKLEFNFPMGLCLTKEGLLLVAGNSNKRVQVLGSDLTFIRFISCTSNSRIWDVLVDGSGNLHAVADDRVEVYRITGEKITEYGKGVLTRGSGVTFLNAALYNKCSPYSFVTECIATAKVYVFDWLKNTLLHSFPAGNYPLGIIIDREGTIIVPCYNQQKLACF